MNYLRNFASVMALVACWISAPVNADIITTSFSTNNGQAGNMFDVNVLASPGIDLTSLELNLDPGNWDISLYTKIGSYVGSETNASDWTLHSQITGLTSNGTDTATPWDIPDLNLSSGINSFYVVNTNGTAINYYNGGGVGSVEAADANIEVFEGLGRAGLFGAQFSPRVFSGSLEYNVAVAVPEPHAAFLIAITACGSSFRRRR